MTWTIPSLLQSILSMNTSTSKCIDLVIDECTDTEWIARWLVQKKVLLTIYDTDTVYTYCY